MPQISTLVAVGAVIMLAVLGHGVWHGGETAVANFIVSFFTGAHVTG